MKKVLIIEDEKNLARFIELELQHEGYETQISLDGREGLELALKHDYHLILLDVMLPELNGFEVCRRVRQVKQSPIIMLTARDSVIDRVSGLDCGADDYIPKPFAIEELLARMRSIERRMGYHQQDMDSAELRYRHLTVHPDQHLVMKDDQVVELTKREYDLFLAFMRNMNRVLTREVLLDTVWGYESFVETNVVDVYVRYLRNKLDHPEEESVIQTVRGTGYVMRL